MNLFDLIRMAIQWPVQWFVRAIGIHLGLVLCAIGVWRIEKRPNIDGIIEQAHTQKYIDQGSSGLWECYNFKDKVLLPWTNAEDGLLGEKNGKQSVRCGGNERSLWNMYNWSAIRNPFNFASRVWKLFSLHLTRDVKRIDWWGHYTVHKHLPSRFQWQLVRTHTKGGWGYYYGFRLLIKGLPYIHLGSKVKPSHVNGDDPDDQLKGTTFRLAGIDWLLILCGWGWVGYTYTWPWIKGLF